MSVMQDPVLSAPADERERLQAAWNQLNLVLGFFPRIDAKLSVVLGIDLGMLALVGGRMPPLHVMDWWLLLIAALFATAIAAGFYHLWKGAFPDLNGGTNSIVYFKSIARMSESAFRHAYSTACPATLANDVLNQAWRNSKILDCKFGSLRKAFVAAICAVIPWVILLIILPTKTNM